MGTEIDLIVGLGNPGPEYQVTRHNAGFWFVDLLAREHGARFGKERKLKGETAEVRIAGRRVRLLKPMTQMNLSGESVQAAVSYYKIPVENVRTASEDSSAAKAVKAPESTPPEASTTYSAASAAWNPWSISATKSG